jgi:hypothetical protein
MDGTERSHCIAPSGVFTTVLMRTLHDSKSQVQLRGQSRVKVAGVVHVCALLNVAESRAECSLLVDEDEMNSGRGGRVERRVGCAMRTLEPTHSR